MKKIHELVYTVQGIEDLAAMLDTDFEHAFSIAQRIRRELRAQDGGQMQDGGTSAQETPGDTILEYDLEEIRQMTQQDPQYP